MRVILAAPRGFCAGVNMAIEALDLAIEAYGTPLYVYHEIVHNKWVVDWFRRQGVVFVNDLADVPEGEHLLYSAHGVPPAVLADNRFIVGIIHKSNTAPKRTGDQCWRRYPTEAIRQLMGEDFDEYRRILGGGAATTRP